MSWKVTGHHVNDITYNDDYYDSNENNDDNEINDNDANIDNDDNNDNVNVDEDATLLRGTKQI